MLSNSFLAFRGIQGRILLRGGRTYDISPFYKVCKYCVDLKQVTKVLYYFTFVYYYLYYFFSAFSTAFTLLSSSFSLLTSSFLLSVSQQAETSPYSASLFLSNSRKLSLSPKASLLLPCEAKPDYTLP